MNSHSSKTFDFDLFVIGAGSGGVRASRVAADLGARVAIAEERYFGGTCVNVGCVPKKLFSYAAHYADDWEDCRGFGWNPGQRQFDWPSLLANKDEEIARLNGIYRNILESRKIRIFNERARLVGPNVIEVGGERVSARYILLAVGGWPWKNPFPGNELAITSNEIFHLPALPESMLVYGGGYIATEFASILHGLGVEVALVYRGDKLLRGFDEDVREFITGEIGKRLQLELNREIAQIERADGGNLRVTLNSGATINVGEVLCATGRKPMTGDLGLENTRIRTSANGAIEVDDRFETAEPGIFAVGDVISRVTLTPVALAEGQIVARRLFGGLDVRMDYEYIPSAVFCHPNIATVGRTEAEARSTGREYDVYLAKVRQLKHTLSGRDELSLIKLIVDCETERVIGLHMVGPDAGELAQGFAVAMNCGATKADFDRTIGIHPTLAEEFVTMRNRRKEHAAGA
ncbi:MAG: glutathione-disulfide reductase [Gammaproteobacteria bacterium]|nr:glutathione-disulfide reductase [Gammaproteobacteria bacterium]